MVILDYKTTRAKAAMAGHCTGWISPLSASNDCISRGTHVPTDWWTAAKLLTITPLAIARLDDPPRARLMGIAASQ